MTASRPASRRPHPSHRQPRAHRGGLVVAGGFTVALIGIGVAVGTGAVRTPLTANTASSAPSDVILASMPPTAPASASVNGRGYTLATVPASWAAVHLAKPKPKPKPTPTVTPTPSMTHSSAPAQPSVLTPLATAENQTPTGQNQLAWSEAILRALGAPLTSANILSIGYWMQNEAGSPPSGIVGANNPINVSYAGYGGVPIQDDGDGVTFLRSYPTVTDGVQATAAYLNNGSFDGIVAALKQGSGLMNNSGLASEISEYSGDGYSTIPDSWGQSQGQPLT